MSDETPPTDEGSGPAADGATPATSDAGERSATDEDEVASDGNLQLERRDLMKWGVVGAVMGPAATTSDVIERLSDTSRSSRGLKTVQTKTAPRDYIPEPSYPLSIRGIAPDKNTPQGSNVWLSNTRFSVRDLIAEQQFNRRPVSLREIVTPQQKSQTKQTSWDTVQWENWLGDYDQTSTDHTFTAPSQSGERSRKELLRAVARHATGDFRGVGSGHSHSEAAKPRSNFTDVKNISGDLGLTWVRDPGDSYWRSPNDPTKPHPDHPTREHLVRLGAGTVLQTLNRGILPNKNPPLALPNMGSWDGQTLAGAINTSTHGTGLGLGSFADLVRSVEIVAVPESPVAQGEPVTRMFRVEPENGITDPVAFGNDTNDHDMTLIQDDDVFHDVVVGYGSLGVVYSYTLELQKSYWLHERTWIDTLSSINPYRDAQKYRHYSFLVDLVQPQLTGTVNPVVRVRTRHDRDPQGNPVRANRRQPTERAKSGTNIFDNLMKEWYEQLRSLVMPQENPENAGNWKDPVQATGDGRVFLGNIVQNALTSGGKPFKRNRNETASHIALRRTRAKVTDPAKDPNPPNQNALTLEMGVPARRVKSAIKRVIREVQQSSQFVPAPLGVRFTAGSPHKFSPEYKRETAMLEIIQPIAFRLRYPKVGKVYAAPVKGGLLKNKDYAAFNNEFNEGFIAFLAWQKLKALLKANNMEHFWKMGAAKNALEVIEEPLLRQFDGRPHMGKHNTLDWRSSKGVKRPQNMYPTYDDWLDAFEYFNQFKTFDGLFTDNKVDTGQINRQ